MGTALLGIAGGFDAAAKGPYSFWTSIPTIIAYIMFCLSLVGFFCAIRDVPIPPPIGSRGAKSAAPAVIPPAEETLPKDPEPVRSGQARAALTLPGVKKVISPLLSGDARIANATRARLLHLVGSRIAALVELSMPRGVDPGEVREQFMNVFRSAFGYQSEQPPDPRPISSHYMRCLLTQDEISALADQDAASRLGSSLPGGTIYRIWPDYRVRAHIDRSVRTIKADTAARVYGASGMGIVWAVIDSGIDKDHPHFSGGTVADPAVASLHRDFTGLLTADGTVTDDPAGALVDVCGHGTHVAGIIAGSAPTDPEQGPYRGEPSV